MIEQGITHSVKSVPLRDTIAEDAENDLRSIITMLVDDPNKTRITRTVTESRIIFEVYDLDQAGHIIGASGRAAQAIRRIMEGNCNRYKRLYGSPFQKFDIDIRDIREGKKETDCNGK